MIENIQGVLAEIKNIKGVRFYFLIITLFVFSLIFLFKDEITVSVDKHVNNKELKLRHSDTSKIRHVIEKIYDPNMTLAYILYLYQPEKPVIKRLEMASDAELENDTKLNEFVLSRQKFITDGLKRSDYVLLDAEHASSSTEKFHRINGVFIPYIYIYGVRNTEDDIIGEIHLWFNEQPTDEQLKKISSTLSETAWYIY